MEDTVKKKHMDPQDDQQKPEETKKEKKSKTKEYIESLEAKISELNDKLLRNAAELENFKKRMQQERIQDRKFASKTLISDLLTPLDQLNKVVHMPTDHDLLKNFLIGFKMINDQIYQVLFEDGLKEIEAINQPFDPKYHYAIEKGTDPSKPNGINLEVIQKGYVYKDQLIRPATVKINEWSEEHGKDE